MSSLSAFISSRQTLREESAGHRRRSPAVAVAIGGVALSVMVMLVSIAVVTGFKSQIRDKIVGFDSQITLAPLSSFYAGGADSRLIMQPALCEAVEQALKPWPNASATPAATLGGIIKTSDDFLGTMFRSIDPEGDCRFISDNLTEGELPDSADTRGLTISQSIADRLGLAVGDKTDAYFISGTDIRPRRFEVRAIYCSNFGEYDNNVVFIPYSTLSRLLKLEPGQAQVLKISGLPLDRVEAVAGTLQSSLNQAYARGQLSEQIDVSTVFSSGAIYFNWLALLDTNVAVILVLMACVSGFMLVSCVLILILQRVRMIGILKALGATNRQISAIFVRLGMRVTLSGIVLGNLMGLSLIFIQQIWHVVPLDPEAYYLSSVPVELQGGSWMLLNAGVLAFSLAVLLVPATLISRLSPLRAINFE